MIDFSIVIPLYNEEECAQQSIQGILQALEGSCPGRYELILVINGSTDRTGEICDGFARRLPQIKTLRSLQNLGYGGGILRGLAHSQGTYCGFMCGDGQVAPETLIRVIDELTPNGPDLVKTTRIHRGDGTARRLQSSIYNWLFRLLFGIQSSDINAMPKMMRRDLVPQLALEAADWFIDAEIMIKAHYAGLQVKEIPIEYLKRIGGTSAVGVSTVFEFLRNALHLLVSGKIRQWKQIRCVIHEKEPMTASIPPR